MSIGVEIENIDAVDVVSRFITAHCTVRSPWWPMMTSRCIHGNSLRLHWRRNLNGYDDETIAAGKTCHRSERSSDKQLTFDRHWQHYCMKCMTYPGDKAASHHQHDTRILLTFLSLYSIVTMLYRRHTSLWMDRVSVTPIVLCNGDSIAKWRRTGFFESNLLLVINVRLHEGRKVVSLHCDKLAAGCCIMLIIKKHNSNVSFIMTVAVR